MKKEQSKMQRQLRSDKLKTNNKLAHAMENRILLFQCQKRGHSNSKHEKMKLNRL
jgi:hypothetical protein